MRCLFLVQIFFLVFILSFVCRIYAEEHNEKEEESEDETDFYFYANQTDASSLVTEYIAPHEDWNGTFPDFIYSPDQVKGIRIVEFYAHWCPHCQHFRSHYIQFAKQTKNLLREYSPETTLNTFAISCVPWKPICQDMDIKGYPTLIIFQDGSVNGTVLHYYELHPFKILSMLGIQYTEESALLVDQEAKESSSFVRKTPNRQPSRDAFFLPRTKKEIYDDAHLSFDFAMRNALFLDKEKPLYNETSRTLRDWIDQLKDALPPTIGSLKTLVSEISESMEDILRANGNGGEAMIKSILDRYPPKRKTWSYSCTRGDKYAGYTCGESFMKC
jgi:thiol-disulfide isomerase/thioredoxin